MDENLSFKKHGAGSKAARWARKHYVGKNTDMVLILIYLKEILRIVQKLFIKHIDMK